MNEQEILAALPPTPNGTVPTIIDYSNREGWAVRDRPHWSGIEKNRYLTVDLQWVTYEERRKFQLMADKDRSLLLARIAAALASRAAIDVSDDECW